MLEYCKIQRIKSYLSIKVSAIHGYALKHLRLTVTMLLVALLHKAQRQMPPSCNAHDITGAYLLV